MNLCIGDPLNTWNMVLHRGPRLSRRWFSRFLHFWRFSHLLWMHSRRLEPQWVWKSRKKNTTTRPLFKAIALMIDIAAIVYCTCTRFYTFLETRGTRSCIRVHGSGVLAVFLYFLTRNHNLYEFNSISPHATDRCADRGLRQWKVEPLDALSIPEDPWGMKSGATAI